MTSLLGEVYGAVTTTVVPLTNADFERPTRAAAWTVKELLLHQLLHAQRALVTLASPTDEGPDVDEVAAAYTAPSGLVEHTVHLLDLTVDLPGSTGPVPAALAESRRVLEQLLGEPLPEAWHDTEARAARHRPAARHGQPAAAPGLRDFSTDLGALGLFALRAHRSSL